MFTERCETNKMSLLKFIKSNLAYKKPENAEAFEFLEDESENEPEGGKEEPVSSNINNSKERKARNKRIPLKLDELKNIKKQYKNHKQYSDKTIVPNLTTSLERIKKEFNMPKNQDVIIREFKIARSINAFLFYINGMVDNNNINNFILRQLMMPEHFNDFKEDCSIDYIINNLLSINNVTKEMEYDKIINFILNGATAIFVEGCTECLIINNQGYEKRNVEKPVTENVIRGAQEGFTEDMRTNITLIRKIIKNKNLITEIMPVDKTNRTNCALLYVEGIVNPTIVNEVKRRIKNLNIDFISGNGMLEELIADHTLMPFTQTNTTERPDRASANIMDGKVILIIEGSPFVSTIPTSFFEAIMSPEDFNLKWQFSTFLRLLRIIALFITTLLPGLYVAVVLFHQEMIPTELLNSIVKARENVPFSTIVEIILMEFAFELIREGGIRVPGVIGNTLGIVGALILGQAAVQAQLASPILIIIISVVGISSFAIPSYSVAFVIRLFRFAMIFLGALAGFYGISIGIVILMGLACSLKSFGVPFLAPIAPKTKANPDIITSLSSYRQKIRPDFANPLNKYKAGKTTEEWINGKGGNKK